MAKYSNVVEYNVVTNVDTSGITKLQNELVKLKQSLKFDKDSFSTLGFDNARIDQSIRKVNQLQNALTAAFNPKIGTLDLSKLNNSLQREHTNLQMIVKDWESMGTRGNMAISSLSNALLSMNKGAVTINTTLSKIANTFSNTVRWGITASIFQEMVSSVQGAVSYMKDLDESLTQIQMVTNSSKENMRELAQYANNAAQALGSTTVDYTNAVKVFVQEGFSESESKQYANLSTKLANVSEQNTATTSDQITAYRNAFQLDYQQTVEAMDKVANVANSTASNVNELMAASQRAASVAQAVGSSQDSFLAAIATIESVTRQSAEEIGNGLKAIYQRFADIKVGKSAEDGVDYGQYATALKSVGVDVLDVAGKFKGMDQILSELQDVWSELDDTMKIAVGEKVAGKFQYNRFAALMNNPEYYQKALSATGEGAEGMMDQMNEIYTESIEGRLKTLQAAGEQVMSTLFNQDDVEPVIETLTDVVNAINDIVDAAGGLQGVLPVVGGLLIRTFSKELAGSITNMANSIQMILANSRNANNFSVAVDLMGLRGATKESPLNAQLTAGVADNYSSLSESTREKLRDLSQQILELEEERTNVLKEQEVAVKDIYEQAAEEQRIAREELELEKQKLGLDEEQYEVEKAEIQILESREKINGSLSTREKRDLEDLKSRVALFEKEDTAYDEIVQKCSIYNEKLLRGEEITEEELKNIISWRDELNNIGISVAPLDDVIERMGQINSTAEKTEKTVKDVINTTTLEARLNNITRAIGGLSSALIGIQMLGEMFHTLSDETATAEEKFTAFTMNGLMGITMLLPVVIDFVKAIAAAKEGSLAFAAAEKIRAAASAAANGALLLNPVVLGVMAAVAAAAIGIAVAHEAIFGAVDRANKKLEEQQEILKQTKSSYQALDEKVEDITTKMESISDTKQSLSEIAKGTEEWKDKVEELNDQVYELLEAYPELIEFVKSENGVLSIDTEDKEYLEYIADLKNQKTQARQSTLLQQGNVKNAENNAQLESFKLKYGVDNLTLDDISNKSIDELKNSIDSSRQNYDSVITALTNLKQTVDTNNTYLDNVNSTVSKSLGYANYAGTKISDYENQDLSQYQTTREIATTSSQKDSITGTSKTTYGKTQVTEWDTSKEEIQEAIKQYYSDLKDITEIASVNTPGNPHGISFKYTDEEGKSAEKTIDETEVETVLKTYLQSSQYISDSFIKNAEIFKMFGATVDETTQEFKDSEGNVITSLDELGSVTKEQAEIMSKFANDTDYEGFMSAIYDGADNFAREIASGNYAKSSKFADYEAGIQAFSDTEAFEAFKESKLIARSPEAQSVREEYNNFETLEDFTRAVKDNVIQLDGLAEAVKKLTPDMVDLTKNINGNEFTNRVDFTSTTDEKTFEKFLKDTGMSEGAFNRMSRDTYEEEGGYYQTNKEKLEEDIEDQKEFIATLKEGDEALEEEQQKLAGMQSELEDLDDAAKDTTAMILRMSNGVVTLRGKISDISEILTNDALEGTTEWYQALDDLDQGLSEVLNIDAGTLSDTFIESGDALEYAQRMAEGDMSAIDDLRRAASKDIIQNLSIQLKEGEDINTVRSDLLSGLNQLQAEIDAGTITVTTDLDNNPFIQKLNKMLSDSQISAEQASQILSSIGMDAKIEHKKGTGYVQQISYHPRFTSDAVEIGEGGPRFPGIEMVPEMTSVETEIDIPYLVGTHYTGSGVQTANTAASNPSYTGGYSKNPKSSGGGNKSPKGNSKQGKHNQKKEKEKNEWDYLTDITNDLERQSAVMEKLANLEDRLYGADRIANLQQERAEHAKNIGLLEKEVKLAEKHKKTLQTQGYDENGNLTINAYARRAGFDKIQFDSAGNLENGKAIEAALTKRENDAIAQYNLHRNDEDTSYYEEQVRLAKEDHDGFMKAVSDYENTLNTIDDTNLEIQKEREALQDAADKIIDSIQNGIDTICDALETQRDFDRMKNQFFRGGEGYSHFKGDTRYYSRTLNDTLGKTFNYKLENVDSRIKDAEKVLNSKDPDKEKISQAQAVQNLKETTDDLISTMKKAVDAYNGLLKTISEASSKMDELIDDRIAAYDRIEKTLDTRLTQLKLMFGENGYKDQAAFYNRKVATAISKIDDLMISKKAEERKIKILKTIEAKNRELSFEQRKELKDATNKVNEIQEEILDTETQALQDNRALLEALTRQNVNETINGIFGGQDLEWLSQEWEMRTRNDEQYLDDYNRAAELEKLQLKYQNLLNNSQNASSAIQKKISDQMKQQLTYLQNKKKYVLDIVGAEKETQSVLKEVNAITKYDVEYAERQLDILQKQIALEEAKNNKNQMRLQRNAAGNYDFVYGADENQVIQATQELINAQQEAYNLAKNAMLQTYEMAMETALKTKETLVEIVMDTGLGAEEQKNRIQEVLGQLGVFINNSRLEYGETIIDTYNEFVEAETTISEQNLGNLTEIFNELRGKTTEYNSSASKDIDDFTISAQQSLDNLDAKSAEVWMHIINQSLDGDGAALPRLIKGWEDTFGESGTMLALFNTMANGVNSSFDDMESHVTGTMLPKMEQGTNPFLGDNGTITTLFLDAWNATETRFSLMSDNTIAGMTTLSTNFSTLTDDMMSYISNFGDTNADVLAAAGDDYYNFTEDSVKEAKDETDNLTESENQFKGALLQLNKVIFTSSTRLNTYAKKINRAFNESEDLVDESTELQESLGEVEYSAAKAADELERLANNSTVDVNVSYNTTYTTTYRTNYETNGYPTYSAETTTTTDSSGSSSGSNNNQQPQTGYFKPTHYSVHDRNGTMLYRTKSEAEAQRYINRKTGGHSGWYIDVGKWDTGGYTGTWTDSGMDEKHGKLAILHKKELVLNADDTKNMLSTVEVVRNIMSNINQLPSLGKNISSSTLNNDVEQRVEINANFPGVTTALEIERALTELADNAYQYANKYKN